MATIVDAAAGTGFPDITTASQAWATFRDLQSEARQAPIDLHLRRRLWWLSSVTVVLCLGAAASIGVIGGSPLLQRVFAASMVIAAACGLWMGWLARTKRMTLRNTTIAWFILSIAVCSAILYHGMFSPIGLMAAVFAIFFVGTRDERRVVTMVYAIVAAFHLAVVAVLASASGPELGAVLGALPFIAAEGAKLWVSELFVQLFLLVTLIASRAIRRTMVTMVGELEDRARALGHHELLLDDAKRAFEASLRAAGGGRFSHQIFGSYRLGRLLGEGAMGEVYEAIDTRSGEEAAVKVLRRRLMEDERSVQRFLTEVRIVRSLSSEHVARVFETAEPGASLPYIAMERLHGRDLRNHLRARVGRRLPLAEADELLRQVARGVDAAHRAGVVHRDLKPSNLFRTTGGVWKILDFGVSKVVGERTENVVVGTPNFMSPEQARGGIVDGRADVFALGAIMYQVITGRLAFAGENLAAVALQVTCDQPPLPSTMVPGLPRTLDDVVMTALAKAPERRHATATAFAEAFSAAVAPFVRRPDGGRAVS